MTPDSGYFRIISRKIICSPDESYIKVMTSKHPVFLSKSPSSAARLLGMVIKRKNRKNIAHNLSTSFITILNHKLAITKMREAN